MEYLYTLSTRHVYDINERTLKNEFSGRNQTDVPSYWETPKYVSAYFEKP